MNPLNSSHSASLSESFGMDMELGRESNPSRKEEFPLFDSVFAQLSDESEEENGATPGLIDGNKIAILDDGETFDDQISSITPHENTDLMPATRERSLSDVQRNHREEVNSNKASQPKLISREKMILAGPVRTENAFLSDHRENTADTSPDQRAFSRSIGFPEPVTAVEMQNNARGSAEDHRATDPSALTIGDSRLLHGLSKSDNAFKSAYHPNVFSQNQNATEFGNDPVPPMFDHRAGRPNGRGSDDYASLIADNAEQAMGGRTDKSAEIDFTLASHRVRASFPSQDTTRIEQANGRRFLNDQNPGASSPVAKSGSDLAGLGQSPFHRTEASPRLPSDGQYTVALEAAPSESRLLPLVQDSSGNRSIREWGNLAQTGPVTQTIGKQQLGNERTVIPQAYPPASRQEMTQRLAQQGERHNVHTSGDDAASDTLENSIEYGPSRQMKAHIPPLNAPLPVSETASVKSGNEHVKLRPGVAETGLDSSNLSGGAVKRFETSSLRLEGGEHVAQVAPDLSRAGKSVSSDPGGKGAKPDTPIPINVGERRDARDVKSAHPDPGGAQASRPLGFAVEKADDAKPNRNGLIEGPHALQSPQGQGRRVIVKSTGNREHVVTGKATPRLNVTTVSQPGRDDITVKGGVDHQDQKQSERVTQLLRGSEPRPSSAGPSNAVSPASSTIAPVTYVPGVPVAEVSSSYDGQDIAPSPAESTSSRPGASIAERPSKRILDSVPNSPVSVSEPPFRSKQPNTALTMSPTKTPAMDVTGVPSVHVSPPSDGLGEPPNPNESRLLRSGAPIVMRPEANPPDLTLKQPDTAKAQVGFRTEHQPMQAAERHAETQNPKAANNQVAAIAPGDPPRPALKPHNAVVETIVSNKSSSNPEPAKPKLAEPMQGRTRPESRGKPSDGNQSVLQASPAVPDSGSMESSDLEPKPLPLSQHVMGEQGPRGVSTQSPTPNAQPANPSPTAQILQSIPTTSGQTVEIAMNPEELGHLRITLDTSDGGAKLSIVVERGETLDLLRRHSGELSSELRQMGYQTVDFDFSRDKQQQDQTSHRFEDNSDSAETDAPADNTNPADTDVSGVDVRV